MRKEGKVEFNIVDVGREFHRDPDGAPQGAPSSDQGNGLRLVITDAAADVADPGVPRCCPRAAVENVRTAADTAAIIDVRSMAFLLFP
jgi:hypothetical protein